MGGSLFCKIVCFLGFFCRLKPKIVVIGTFGQSLILLKLFHGNVLIFEMDVTCFTVSLAPLINFLRSSEVNDSYIFLVKFL